VLIIGVESLVNTGFAVLILFDYVAQGGEASGVLVLLYWVLQLPALGTEIASTAQQYPMLPPIRTFECPGRNGNVV